MSNIEISQDTADSIPGGFEFEDIHGGKCLLKEGVIFLIKPSQPEESSGNDPTSSPLPTN